MDKRPLPMVWTRARRLPRKVMACQDGTILVEFALVAPILIVIVMTIVGFGSSLFIHNNMVNVARDASRRAATGEFTTSQAESFARGALVDWGISYSVNVTVPDPNDDAARDVVAVISAPFSQAAIVDILGLLGGRTLTASVIMRQE